MVERIRLSGRLDADGRMQLRPAFATRIPPHRWAADNVEEYVAEVQDRSGTALTRAPLSAALNCTSNTISLRGSIDLPDDAARLEVLRLDPSRRSPIVLASEEIPRRAPTLAWTSVPEDAAEGGFDLGWEAGGDPPPVRYFVDYSTGRETWEPLSTGIEETSLRVDFDDLAGGDECRVAVTASNGLRSARIESPPFRVRPKPCAAVIVRPGDGPVPAEVLLVGNGWWREEGRAEVDRLWWTSDRQGELGTGQVVAAVLEPGRHEVTLQAGEGERAGYASISIDVGGAG